jgi:Ser/Thr protein kinase RdoA (MazF antagonist)
VRHCADASQSRSGRMSDRPASGIERFLFGAERADEVDEWLHAQAQRHLSRDVDRILFRAGRIDAVYGLRLSDGQAVVLKVHRPPAPLARLRTIAACQRFLVQAGYPCAPPLRGPMKWGRHLVSVEALLVADGPGTMAPAAVRAAMAIALAAQVQILSRYDGPLQLDPQPAWTVYQHGPWPAAHDALFDFTRRPPAGWAWVDAWAAQAADTLNATHQGGRLAGHSDWHQGNVGFSGGTVTAVYDLDLFADDEPVIAGFAAAGHAKSSAAGPVPAEVAAFLAAYDDARPGRFDIRQQRQALAAAAWALAYNARCALSVMNDGDPPPSWSLLPSVNVHRRAYLTAHW